MDDEVISDECGPASGGLVPSGAELHNSEDMPELACWFGKLPWRAAAPQQGRSRTRRKARFASSAEPVDCF
eukprot:1899764-Amphidinium_carterae.1